MTGGERCDSSGVTVSWVRPRARAPADGVGGDLSASEDYGAVPDHRVLPTCSGFADRSTQSGLVCRHQVSAILVTGVVSANLRSPLALAIV
jgi:hypothetical protein